MPIRPNFLSPCPSPLTPSHWNLSPNLSPAHAYAIPHLVPHVAVVIEALLQRGADGQVNTIFKLKGLAEQVGTGVPEGL